VGHDKWEETGAPSLLDRARKRLHEITENHRPVAIPKEKAQAIQSLVDQFSDHQ
jgi:trimethylamine:corrinoid methyltransferase-like protein